MSRIRGVRQAFHVRRLPYQMQRGGYRDLGPCHPGPWCDRWEVYSGSIAGTSLAGCSCLGGIEPQFGFACRGSCARDGRSKCDGLEAESLVVQIPSETSKNQKGIAALWELREEKVIPGW